MELPSLLPLLIVYSVLVVFLFNIPLSRAFMAGLAAARDPAHRVTPVDPWIYFGRAVGRKLRPWLYVWSAVLYAIALPMILRVPNRSVTVIEGILLILLEPAVLLSLWSISFIVCCRLAPRVNSVGFLAFLESVGAAAGYLLILFLRNSSIPPDWFFLTVSRTVSKTAKLDFFPHCLAAASIFAAFMAWGWLRRNGDHWFRFEQ